MDLLTKAVTKDGFMRIYFANSRETVEKARKYHNLSPVASAALGRTLVAGQLMGAMLKNDEATVTIQFKGGGEAGIVLVVGDAKGGVKGYIENPYVDLPLNRKGKLDVGGAVGKNGFLSVIRDLKMKEPYIGQVPIVSGEIAEDIANYFAVSEQIPTVCGLGVLVNPDLTVKAAGGYLIQLLPFADESCIDKLEANVNTLQPVTAMLDSGMSAEDIAKRVLEGLEPDLLDEFEVFYKCDCNKSRVEKALISLGKEELSKMAEEEEQIEVCCHFCDKKYEFTVEDLKKFLK